MVSAASMFRKSGFNDSDAAILAKVAASYQNVADTAVSAEDAAASIVSQIRAFGKDANFATHVIDAYNEVANNFNVGTNGLSKAMEIAASGMATYGNSFEQVIGLVTSGTEIMQGRSSQVARGLSTIAARIVKNQDALAEYGITVENVDGSLKSTFDVLSELKPKWDSMTDAQRTALGDTIAGQNQYKVLASVMQNFGHAADATKTALESAGSAAQENSKYMESLEAKQQALKAEFEDFANRVLSKDLVSGFINAGTAMLNFANNDVGAAITRIGVLSTGITGLVGIVGQTVGKMAEVGLQLKNLGVGGGSFLGLLSSGKLALIIGGVTLAVTALVEIIRALKASYDAAHPSFEDANKNLENTQNEIKNTTDKLKEYREQLEKLDDVNVEDRGASWQNERSELELNIEASQSYLDILERIAELQGQQTYAADRPSGYSAAGSIQQNPFQDDFYYGEYLVKDNKLVQLSAKQASILNAQYSDQYQALTAITLALADATDEQYRYIEAEDLAELTGKSQEEQIEIMTDMLGKLGIVLDTTYESSEQAFSNMGELASKTGELTQAQKEQAQTYISSYDEIVKVGAATKEQAQNYVDLAMKISDFDSKQESAADTISFVADLFDMSASEAARFASSLGYIDSANIAVADGMVQLADGAWALSENCYQAEDGLYHLKDGCDALAGAGDLAAGAIGQIQVAVYDTNTATAKLTASLFDANGNLTTAATTALQGSMAMQKMATSELQAQQAAAQANFENLIKQINAVSSSAIIASQQLSTMMALAGVSTGGASASVSSSNLQRTYKDLTGKTAQADTAAYNQWVQSYLLEKGSSYYDKVQKETQDKLDQITKAVGVGTGGGGSSRKYQEEAKAQTINTVEELRKYLTDEETRLKLIDPDISKSDLQSTLSEVATIYKSYQDYLSQLKQQGFDETSEQYKQAEAEFAKFLAVLEELFNEIAKKGNFTIEELFQKFQSAIGEASTTLDKFGSKSSNANATKGTRYRDPAGATIREMRMAIENQYEAAVQNAIENSDAERAVAEEVADEYDRQNQLLEDKIALEEKLEALEKAKQRRMLVYSEGRFQYMQDADAISSAQKDYQETYRGIEQSQTKELMSMLGEESKAFFEDYFSNPGADVLNYPDALRNHMLQYAQGQISGTVYEGMSEGGLYNTFGGAMKPGDAYNQVLTAYQEAERARELLRQMEADLNKQALEESVRYYGVDTDFGEKIKNAKSLDEVAYWTKLRDAKQQMIREYRALYGDEAASKYFGTDVSKQDTWKSNEDLYKEAYESGSKAWWFDKEQFHRQYYVYPEDEWTVKNPDLKQAQYNAATAVNMEGFGDQRLYNKIFSGYITKDEIQDLYDKSTSEISKGYLLNLASEMHKAGYPGYARGTRNANKGLSLVGENGPELRVLNQGDGILPSGITDNLWRWGSMTPSDMLASLAQRVQNWAQIFNINNVTLPNVRDAQSFVSGLRELAQQYVTRRS